MLRLLLCLGVFVCIAAAPPVPAPVAPPPPMPKGGAERYNVVLKYRINARSAERIRQFNELSLTLRAAGFVRTDKDIPEGEPADPRSDTMTGTLPVASVPKVISQRHIRNLLLWPEGSKMPPDDTLVRVDVYLDTGYAPEAQRKLARRVADELGVLGFSEAFGYDTEGGTRLVGAVKAGSLVPALSDPMRKLTREARWLLLAAPDQVVEIDVSLDHTPAIVDEKDKEAAEKANEWRKIIDIPGAEYKRRIGAVVTVAGRPGDIVRKLAESPRVVSVGAGERVDVPRTYVPTWPVRVIIARPDADTPSRRPEPPTIPEGQERFSPELRALLAGGGDKSARLEVLLATTPDDRDETWLGAMRRAGVTVEGRVGPLVTVAGVPKDAAPKLAEQPEVIAVRLPRAARGAPALDGVKPAGWSALRRSGLVELHEKGKKGRGQRIALIADDFAGWEELPGSKQLVDLTVIRGRLLDPDPFPSAGKGQGPGTRYARDIREAAPDADLILIRIDPAAPYMLQIAARAINGEVPRSALLTQRIRDLDYDREALGKRADEVRLLRQIFLDDPVGDEGLKREEAYKKAQEKYDAAEAEMRRRTGRWLKLQQGLRELKGVTVVASTLVWTDGFPVDGSSALSRYFDERPFKAALWFQAAGDTRGQAWAGLFRDADGNGFMEFAEAKKRLPPGSWSHEIAWLAWQAPDGKKAATPAGTPIRLVLQWKEPHDPTPLKVGEDPYRDPLAKMRLVVVNQPDPAGKTRPADDLEVVAQSAGPAIRLEQSLHAATYEITLEIKADRPGRYGVLIEGKAPDSIHPPGTAVIPASRKTGEINVRLSVDAPPAVKGRAVWDSLPATAALGVPADSRRVLTVGAATAEGVERPDSAAGVMGAELWVKPDLTAYGVEGTGQAAAFAAGFAATASGKTGSLAAIAESIRMRPGKLLVLPPKR